MIGKVRMGWLRDFFYTLTNKGIDAAHIQHKMQSVTDVATINFSNDDLLAYVSDLEIRINNMEKQLKSLYKKYNIVFAGFTAFEQSCVYLRESIQENSAAAYDNLIKIESTITAEQRRHLGLIRMAVMPDGKRVMDAINQDPKSKQTFEAIFGAKDSNGKVIVDGVYQHLWSEIHKLSEYLLLHKNKIYH